MAAWLVAGCAFAVVLAVPAGGCASAAGGDAAMTGRVHGTLSAYQYYGCRCAACRAANAAVFAAGRASRAARLRADPSAAPHGSASTYKNWDCRCPDCKTAWSKYLKARRAGSPLSYYLPEAGR